MEPVLLQLMARVEDGTTYVDTIVTLIGAMVILLGAVLGLGIWQNRQYTRRLLDDQFLRFQERELTPALADAHTELDNCRSAGIRVMVESQKLLFDRCFEEAQRTYRQLLELKCRFHL